MTLLSVGERSSSDDAGGLRISVFVSPPRRIRRGGTFPPTTSTLIFGASDAILVDAQAVKDDVDALADLIEETGRRLTAVVITHGHPDHYFGAARLAERFPALRIVATAGVVEYIRTHLDQDLKMWLDLFTDEIVRPDLLPAPLEGGSILLEGKEMPVVEIGQGDIAPSAIVQVPELDALVVGDLAYNKVHPMLALGGPGQWADWIASIDKLAKMRPRTIVVGHKKPEASDHDVATMLDGTRSYIRDFGEAIRSAESPDALIEVMMSKYPDYANPWTLQFSSQTAMRRKSA